MSNNELFEHLIKTNKNDYNLRKLLEESIELNEVIIKMINKSADNKPPIEKLIEESGDLLFRLGVVIRQFNIKPKVLLRVEEKGEQIKKWISEKKYSGGV